MEVDIMGMGWVDKDYSYVNSEHKCKCGKGMIQTVRHVTEESDYPPFERYTESIKTTCPDNCQNIK